MKTLAFSTPADVFLQLFFPLKDYLKVFHRAAQNRKINLHPQQFSFSISCKKTKIKQCVKLLRPQHSPAGQWSSQVQHCSGRNGRLVSWDRCKVRGRSVQGTTVPENPGRARDGHTLHLEGIWEAEHRMAILRRRAAGL